MKALKPLLHISADGFTYLRFHSHVCLYMCLYISCLYALGYFFCLGIVKAMERIARRSRTILKVIVTIAA